MSYWVRPIFHNTYSAEDTAINITRIICEEYKVTLEELKSKSRHRRHYEPRQLCFKYIRRKTPLTYDRIGQMFGGRDHSTVVHGIDRIEDLARVDDAMKANGL